jgi:hypothetical protein
MAGTLTAPELSSNLYPSIIMQALAERWLEVWTDDSVKRIDLLSYDGVMTYVSYYTSRTGVPTLCYVAHRDGRELWCLSSTTHEDKCAVLRHCLSTHVEIWLWPTNNMLSALLAFARSSRTHKIARLYTCARHPRVQARRQMALLRLVQFLRERMHEH